MAILQDVSKANGKTSMADLQAELEKLRQENAKLKEARNAKISFKVSEKRALSCYGMGRFPITLYKSQWLRLIEVIPQIKAFIEAHASELADKE